MLHTESFEVPMHLVISSTDAPYSACFKAKAICCSVYLLFFTCSPPIKIIELLRNSQIDNYLVGYNSLMGLYFRRYYVFVMASRAFCGVAIQKRKII
jgi:hypothetical protein